MANDVDEPIVIDIRDQPILERGIPAEGESPSAWLGALLRTVVDLIGQLDGGTADAPRWGWNEIRDGLAATAEFIQAEMVAAPAGSERPAVAELSMPCPGVDNPQERREWAQSMTAILVGLMATYQPLEDGGDGPQWWALMTRGLELFSAFVLSDDGPLTWTT